MVSWATCAEWHPNRTCLCKPTHWQHLHSALERPVLTVIRSARWCTAGAVCALVKSDRPVMRTAYLFLPSIQGDRRARSRATRRLDKHPASHKLCGQRHRDTSRIPWQAGRQRSASQRLPVYWDSNHEVADILTQGKLKLLGSPWCVRRSPRAHPEEPALARDEWRERRRMPLRRPAGRPPPLPHRVGVHREPAAPGDPRPHGLPARGQPPAHTGPLCQQR
jgi:hypothetical protein